MKQFLHRLREEYGYLMESHFRNREWSLSEVGRFWDSVADYDDINEQAYSYFRRFTDSYRLSNLSRSSKALDICARTGKGTEFFFEKGKIGQVVCADVSGVFQEICAQHLERCGVPFETLLFDTYDLPFPNAEFDLILCFETIEHVSRPDKLIRELSRLLKSGGTMILTCPNIAWEPVHSLAAVLDYHHSEGPHRFLRRKSLIRMLTSHAFEIEKEGATVLVPGGPSFLLGLGESMEKHLPFVIKSMLCLRRIFICRKI